MDKLISTKREPALQQPGFDTVTRNYESGDPRLAGVGISTRSTQKTPPNAMAQWLSKAAAPIKKFYDQRGVFTQDQVNSGHEAIRRAAGVE